MYSLFVFLFFIPSVKMETPTASISSHVLDIALGRPAEGVNIHAYVEENGAWKLQKSGYFQIFGFYFSTTTSNGRVPWVTPNVPLIVTNYKLTFMTGDYYKEMNMTTFYPSVEVIFYIADATQHYHVPLTLSPYGYSTYRGS
ncbi:hydroxyisourate hydrolase [Necator americanus]|uniref:5-hydroxyisourate hydrolase n=1 Tax=Necator americanus TaxID=51031 RepID=W2T0P0_NECAM|nr:hydroxyisourate hydrolase [Necator americanus]ETN75575.1 hydroxyisourate hydrolase [Necator americanus]